MRLNSSLLWVMWNTFLAVMPILLAHGTYWMALQSSKRPALKAPAVILALAWLAFLPNTCYLLTEWRHYLATLDAADLYLRSHNDGGAILHLMFYTTFYFCYSALGMLAFALAIRPMAQLARRNRSSLLASGALLFLMVSIGVYLGLILRYNSWDLITRPQQIWISVSELATRPVLAAFLVAFAAFLWLAYTAIDIWIDGFMSRWQEWKRQRPSMEVEGFEESKGCDGGT